MIDDIPRCRRFAPDIQQTSEPVIIHFEELEALRLKDITGQDQNDCAQLMGLSRQTFQRVLLSARAKVANALVEGKTILIEGGNFTVKNRVFECTDCGKIWEVEPCAAGGKHGFEIACPSCGSMKKVKLENGQRHTCGGNHHDHDHGHHHGGGCCGGHK